MTRIQTPSKRRRRRGSGSSAVLVVDVQRAFAPPAAYVRRLRRFTDTFPLRIFTRFINPPGSLHRRHLRETGNAPGSPGLELVITPRPGDWVLDKRGRYGLTAAQVRRLRDRGIRDITVCGLDTDACVLAVMFSLFDGGLMPRLHEPLLLELDRPAARGAGHRPHAIPAGAASGAVKRAIRVPASPALPRPRGRCGLASCDASSVCFGSVQWRRPSLARVGPGWILRPMIRCRHWWCPNTV